MDMGKAVARIKLPREAVELELVNDGFSVFAINRELPAAEGSTYQLEIEGLIETEEAFTDDEPLEILRGSLYPTKITFEVIG